MIKKILSTAILSGAALMAGATGYNTLKVHLLDGTKVDVSLSEDLRLNFDKENLLANDGITSVSIERAKIARFEHSYTSGVNGVASGKDVNFSNNTLYFASLPAGSQIRVYSSAGEIVAEAQAEGTYTLPLDGLASGTYIVSVNQNSFKILIK